MTQLTISEQTELDLARGEWEAEIPSEPPEGSADIWLSTDLYVYLVSQDEVVGDDFFDSFVCIAQSEEEARDTNPWKDASPIDWDNQSKRYYGDWATRRDAVKVKLLGVALHGSTPGVVCASYNAD
jgi:hypothetical protein